MRDHEDCHRLTGFPRAQWSGDCLNRQHSMQPKDSHNSEVLKSVVFSYWVSPGCGSRAPSILSPLWDENVHPLSFPAHTLEGGSLLSVFRSRRKNDRQDKSHILLCSVWMIQIRCGFLTGRQWQGDLGYTRCWNDSIFGDFETGEWNSHLRKTLIFGGPEVGLYLWDELYPP